MEKVAGMLENVTHAIMNKLYIQLEFTSLQMEPDEFSCPNCEQEGVDEVHEGKLLDHFKKQLNSRSYMYLNLHGRGNYFENLRI